MKEVYLAPVLGYASLLGEGVLCTSFIGTETVSKTQCSDSFETWEEDSDFTW